MLCSSTSVLGLGGCGGDAQLAVRQTERVHADLSLALRKSSWAVWKGCQTGAPWAAWRREQIRSAPPR